MTLAERMEQLQKIKDRLPKILQDAAKNATIRAVEKASEMTPVGIDKPLAGTNTRTSGMKQDWAAKSKTTPTKRGDRYITNLNNDMNYASYVNDGHRMDRHFVPGLVIDQESGLLEYNPDGTGGIIVGTRTAYVKGLFMVDAAKEEYRRVLQVELKDLEDLLK